MSDVYIVGTDLLKFQKAGTSKSVQDLGARAALLALQAAGLKLQQL